MFEPPVTLSRAATPARPTGVTREDILRQGRTLAGTLERIVESRASLPSAGHVLFTGCGASFYAAQGAASLLAALTGTDATAAPSSEIWLIPELYLRPDTVVVALSRTGTTTEVVRVLELARARGLRSVAISLGTDVPIYELADDHVALTHVGEVGRVMTQSFANLLLAAQALAVRTAAQAGSVAGGAYESALPDVVAAIAALTDGFDTSAQACAAQRSGHYVFCGSGPAAAVCSQAVLMMQEMTQLPSESAGGLEYRHGPIAGLGAESLLCLVSSPRSTPFDVLLAQDALVLGHQPLVLAATASLPLFPDGCATIELPDGLPAWLYGNVALPFLQLLCYHRTVALGANPEAVRNLDRNTDPHVDPHVVSLTLDGAR